MCNKVVFIACKKTQKETIRWDMDWGSEGNMDLHPSVWSAKPASILPLFQSIEENHPEGLSPAVLLVGTMRPKPVCVLIGGEAGLLVNRKSGLMLTG